MIVRLPEANDYFAGAVLIDQPQFSQKVDRQPYAISHDLINHPLLQLDSLMELSRRLSAHQRQYIFAKQNFGSHRDASHYNHALDADDFSTEEMIRDIEDQSSVIVLRNVESDPAYGNLVEDCLDDLQSQIEPWTGPISGRESFIYISPPRSYTPYHYDPEQNFFLQIRGGKEMAIYDANDREILPESALEDYYGLGQKITKLEGELFHRYQLFTMQPGDGVYVPVTAPHWVRTVDEVSISVSIKFRTPSSIHRDRVYRVNRFMRKIGLRPAAVRNDAGLPDDQSQLSLLDLPARIKRLLLR